MTTLHPLPLRPVVFNFPIESASDIAELILTSPLPSRWLKEALSTLLGTDPEYARQQAEILAAVMQARYLEEQEDN